MPTPSISEYVERRRVIGESGAAEIAGLSLPHFRRLRRPSPRIGGATLIRSPRRSSPPGASPGHHEESGAASDPWPRQDREDESRPHRHGRPGSGRPLLTGGPSLAAAPPVASLLNPARMLADVRALPC